MGGLRVVGLCVLAIGGAVGCSRTGLSVPLPIGSGGAAGAPATTGTSVGGASGGSGGHHGGGGGGGGAQELWSKRFGEEGAVGRFIALGPGGSVSIAGLPLGKIDFGGGLLEPASISSAPLFLARFTTHGDYLWSTICDANLGDRIDAASLAVSSSGHTIVAGSYKGVVDFGGGPLPDSGEKSDAVVVKFDAGGQLLWTRIFGNEGVHGAAAAVAPDGSVFMLVGPEGPIDLGGGELLPAGNGDVFLAKLDSAGGHVWSAVYGDEHADGARGLAATPQGGVVLMGRFHGSIDFGGGPLGTGDGEDWGVFVASLDAGGSPLWSRSCVVGGVLGPSYLEGPVVDSAGNSVFGGQLGDGTIDCGGEVLSSTSPDPHFFLVKLDATGQLLWARLFPNVGMANFNDLGVDGEGNLVLTGEFHGGLSLGGPSISCNLGFDVFVAKLNPQGDHLWTRHYPRIGDAAGPYAEGVVGDGQGYVLTTGGFAGSIDFGSGVLTSVSGRDVYLAKLAP